MNKNQKADRAVLVTFATLFIIAAIIGCITTGNPGPILALGLVASIIGAVAGVIKFWEWYYE